VSDLLVAWQAALAAEHQAVYAYALIGPRVTAADAGLVRRCAAAHAALRDATLAALLAAGAAPDPPRPDYPALYPVPDAAAARRVAVRVEDACAVAWRVLYAAACAPAAAGSSSSAPTPSRRALRTAAQQGLTASAVRATRWRVRSGAATATTPFPGIG
jgi:hypothetical protein